MARKLECRHCGTYNTAGTPCKCGGFESHTEVDAINSIKRISEAKSKDIALITAENVRLQQEVIDLQAVIDAANAQEPVAWVTDDYLTDKSATTYSKEVAVRWEKKGWPVDCLYAKPVLTMSSPRITEQDAREIVSILLSDYREEYCGQSIDSWIESCEELLLNKLNAKSEISKEVPHHPA